MQHFYRFAPLILGIIGVVFGWIGYALDEMMDVDFDFMLWVIISIILGVEGACLGILIRKVNISAQTDQLTGLKNRRYVGWKLSEEAKRDDAVLSVVMVDVDGFKSINDIYGHTAGDEFLKKLAKLFEINVRPTDIVARWGGDEFLIILPQTNVDEALTIAERLRNAVESSGDPQMTLSAGVAGARPPLDLRQLLFRVDTALYQAKIRKNTVQLAE